MAHEQTTPNPREIYEAQCLQVRIEELRDRLESAQELQRRYLAAAFQIRMEHVFIGRQRCAVSPTGTHVYNLVVDSDRELCLFEL